LKARQFLLQEHRYDLIQLKIHQPLKYQFQHPLPIENLESVLKEYTISQKVEALVLEEFLARYKKLHQKQSPLSQDLRPIGGQNTVRQPSKLTQSQQSYTLSAF